MTASRTAKYVGTSAVVGILVGFTPQWEGMDKVAKRDMIGTGHPITYCYGQTSEFGDVKVGTKFTKVQCDAKLAESLPTYVEPIGKCIKVPVPVKVMAAVVDGGYNAGTAAACKSPMVAKINAGNIRGGCEAFDRWYVRSAGKERRGLILRRAGEKYGDHRKSERALCLEGVNDLNSEIYLHESHRPKLVAPAAPIAPTPRPAPRKEATLKPLTPDEFAIDPYSCFGGGRYDAMRDGRECPVATPARWWELHKQTWWRA